ncbi:MAG: HD domain-containing protein [Candidatus Omnitrophota bacterium]
MRLFDFQEDRALLKAAFHEAEQSKLELYLVGGYLRDNYLGVRKGSPDIDFCLKKKAVDFARYLARRISAGFVLLDKEHGCARVVKRIKDKTYTLDFADFRGKSIEEDLRHRDFTINSMALSLKDALASDLKAGEKGIIDPCAGRKDIKERLIRLTDDKAFRDDPLRMLRAFSLSSVFGFRIDGEVLKRIKSEAGLLAAVSFERIRDELFKILQRPLAFEAISKLDSLKILNIIIPEIEVMRGVKQGPYHHLDVWQHTLEALRQFELLLKRTGRNKDIQGYLDEAISGERKRRGLIKLGILLHDIGKPAALVHEEGKTKFHGHERIGWNITKEIAKRLKLSNDEADSLGKMVFWHLRPGYLADNKHITARAKFRYFRDTAREALSILLLSLADQRATKGPLTSEESRIQHEKGVYGLIREYFKNAKAKKPPRLITGDDLIKSLKISPSPLIGKILSEIEELQAIGKIKDKQEALRVARKLIKKSGDGSRA